MDAIEVEGIRQRLIPMPTMKITRDLLSRALRVASLSDPLNLLMRHDWMPIHAERFAPITGDQIDSAVSQGRVN